MNAASDVLSGSEAGTPVEPDAGTFGDEAKTLMSPGGADPAGADTPVIASGGLPESAICFRKRSSN